MAKPKKSEVAPAVDLNNVNRIIDAEPSHQEFMIARASAIEQYANLEQALNFLCAYLMDVPQDVSGNLFFRMNNARARLLAMERLLRKKHADTYNLFWNSLVTHLKPLDDERNKIVHWITKKSAKSDITGNLSVVTWSSLIGANFWDFNSNAPEIFRDDLYSFILKCEFYYHLIMHFRWVISGSPKVLPPAWPGIFLEPVTYPPLRTHPLFRTWPEPGIQPPPSHPK